MLRQLTAEVSELLKDKSVVAATRNILRRMMPMHQIEAAELMRATENYSKSFAKALLVATNSARITTPHTRPIPGLSPEMKGDMQREMEQLLNDLKVTQSYGADILNLVVASGYVSKLIENTAIESYLSRNHPNILRGFRTIVAGVLLDDSSRGPGANEATCGAYPGRSQPPDRR